MPDAKASLDSWYYEAIHATWKSPSDIKAKYRHASILKNGRVVFNIAGNKHRLVVSINYEAGIIFIKFVGTHKEYDKINVEDV
ncbi:type II toxin-antitoxin system HigB family toxin [Pseudovibrio ascidiaceicola]